MNSAPPPPVYPPSYPAYPAAPPSVDSRPVNQQYRSHAAPAFAPAPVPSYHAAPEPERPQYARFEASKPVNEDALPAMPTMSDAKSVHIEETVMPEKHGDMEMDRLDHNGSVTNLAATSAAAVGGPRRSPVQRSPTGESYGSPLGAHSGHAIGGPPQRSPHSTPGPYGGQYGQNHDQYRGEDQYRGISPAQSLSPVYGAGGGYGQTQSYGRRSPNPPNPGYGQQYERPSGRSPAPYTEQQNDHGYSSNPRDAVEMPSPVQHQNNSLPRGPSARSPSPGYSPSGYAPSGSTRFEPPSAYPGQQTYAQPEPAYPGQQPYQAYQPTQEPQYSGVTRKPVDGSWKEL
ncbi:hypothetical protein BCR34DRAFT_179154 [Clohesyomyces aquaticus]|uniref:Uncharacterized protein n=1 Tax=Clohesyomyces aquaticus TaxID=1231657 RepID=A0A1Y1YF64_9PLEO|nr:hypothetical protein BCR34DRAFT_179154 [Clohesyomyces aquaticus]